MTAPDPAASPEATLREAVIEFAGRHSAAMHTMARDPRDPTFQDDWLAVCALAASEADRATAGEREGERLPNACRCGDCYHPNFGRTPCDWCQDCGCERHWHLPATPDADDLSKDVVQHTSHYRNTMHGGPRSTCRICPAIPPAPDASEPVRQCGGCPICRDYEQAVERIVAARVADAETRARAVHPCNACEGRATGGCSECPEWLVDLLGRARAEGVAAERERIAEAWDEGWAAYCAYYETETSDSRDNPYRSEA